jgi:hypothetical protein
MNEIVATQGNSLAIIPQRELSPGIWNMISEMAPVMYKSRLFGISSVEAATAIMLKGYELGLSITASFELVQIVQGRPGLSPRGAMALLLNSPKIKKIKITRLVHTNGSYVGHECYMQRDSGFEYSMKFTMEDAKRAGVVKPGSGWENYPENMCQWRAIGFCADVVAPDITAGMTSIMKMPEQYGVALSGDGDIIDATPKKVETTEIAAPAEEQSVIADLTDLVNKYGAEAVMLANDGQIPGTDEELAAAAKKLAGNQ